MIETLIAEVLRRTARPWKFKGGEYAYPTEEDVTKLLDEAVSMVYDEAPGTTRIETGGLILDKQEDGSLDVYVHVGNYTKEQ